MKTNWLFWLICLAGIAFAIPATFVLANDKQITLIEYQITLKPDKQKVILLQANHLNPQVSVYINGQLQSQQKGPNTLNSREFIVLGPFDQQADVRITADIGFKLEAEYSPIFIDITPTLAESLDKQIEQYRILYKASQLWSAKVTDSHQLAIDLLDSFLNQYDVQETQQASEIVNEAKYLLSSMLFAEKRMSKGAALLQSIEANQTVNWQLSKVDSLLFNARSKFWQRDYEPAILLYCDYLQKADKRHQTHTKILLAQSLIERQRGVKQDKVVEFKVQYRKYCGSVVKDFAASEKLIEDGKKILEGLLVENKHWPEPQLQSMVFGQLWNYYMVNSNHFEAEKMARLAIAYDVNAKQKLQSVDYYWYLGTSLLRQGDFKQAQQVWREGLILSGRADGRGLSATSLFNLAYSYFMVGDYALSKRYFTQALVGDEKSEGLLNWQLGKSCNKDGIYSAMTIVRLGIIARIEGRADEAMTMFECAEAVFDNTNEYYALVAKLEIAKSHIATENTQLAKGYIDEVLNDKRLMQGLKIDSLLARLKVATALQNEVEIDTTVNLLAIALDYDSINFDLEDTHQNYPYRQIEFYHLLIRHYGQKLEANKVNQFGAKALWLIENIKAQVLNTQAW